MIPSPRNVNTPVIMTSKSQIVDLEVTTQRGPSPLGAITPLMIGGQIDT
jgi:hypothetical protein